MFDPTIYENLKIILEGLVYDLDFDGHLTVTDRKDIVDLASMSRKYSIEVSIESKRGQGVRALIDLEAGLKDLADEIMERETSQTGCRFSVTFNVLVQDIESECTRIGEGLRKIWGPEEEVTQKVSYIFGLPRGSYQNEAKVRVKDKLHVENNEQLEEYLERMMTSVEQIFNKGEKK